MELGIRVREWRHGSEKTSDSEQPVQVEPQRRQVINKVANVVDGLLSDEEEVVEEMSVDVPVRKIKDHSKLVRYSGPMVMRRRSSYLWKLNSCRNLLWKSKRIN